ncbi:MAG: MoxR family ATPase [Rhodobacteraceae bacterium]|nr:MoxR family ATPase [Paracoccaceae bacterium]
MSDELLSAMGELSERLERAREMISRRFIGQPDVIDLALVTLLSGGHALVVGVPGLGKTLLVDTIATVMGLSRNRIQFTADLMPADILGSEVLRYREDGSRSFEFLRGPVFCQFLMADEINRASPRTQSALLEAMQDGQVSIDGSPIQLPRPFHVFATQNPVELEGTYPLPEAQQDRFMVQINIDYPDFEDEGRILLATTGACEAEISPVFDTDALLRAQEVVRRIPVGEKIHGLILDTVRAGRPENHHRDQPADERVQLGPSTRAGQALMLAVRARALLNGRLAPGEEDVVEMAQPVICHRMKLNYAAMAKGERPEDIVRRLVTGKAESQVVA